MNRIFILFFLLISISLQAQKTIAIKCGKLLDTKSGNVLTNQVVYIKGNTVLSVGGILKADSTIDLSNSFVMPGMIDCHTRHHK